MSFVYLFITILARALTLLILARVLLTWVPVSRENRIVSLIMDLTEPILGPLRNLLPKLGGLDISPILALVLVQVMERMLLTILRRFL